MSLTNSPRLWPRLSTLPRCLAVFGLWTGAALAQPTQVFAQENAPRTVQNRGQSTQQLQQLRDAVALCVRLGELEAASELEGVMVRLQRSMQARQPFDIQDRGTRIEILRDAKGILGRAGWESGEALLARFLRVSDSFTRNEPPEVQSAAIDSLGPLPEFFPKVVATLRSAAKIAAERGDHHSSRMSRALAEFYEQRQGITAKPTATPKPLDLQDRRSRLFLIRKAAQIMREVGDLGAARGLQRMAQLGQMQLEEAPQEVLSELAQGLSMERYHEQLEVATGAAKRLGRHDLALALTKLREYYRQRGRLAQPASQTAPQASTSAKATQHRNNLRKLEAQLEALQTKLDRMTQRLERMDRR